MTTDLPRESLTRSAEDYLKVIYHLTADGEPAGTTELAQALDLAPASVSGMVKRLAEQGLVHHEPYRGVTLAAEGRRIALRMLRRHRLIESYLVAHLGYTWDTVHDEAERLEHAVSDALVERMAKVLGDPLEDPHGDPIPGPDGSLAEMVYVPLSEIAVGREVEIRRVQTSQADRLRYLSSAGLVPGARVKLVAREPFAGPIRLRVGRREQIVAQDLAGMLLCAPTGAGMISPRTVVLLLLAALPLLAAAPLRALQDEPIRDNSFLVEEAYNQERGVVQHISTFSRSDRGDWIYAFTQEWPLGGIRNQLSYTLPLAHANGTGVGDLMLNYRLQAAGDGAARLAISPRLSLLLPTGSHLAGRGAGGVGWQVALPLNLQLSPALSTVFNAGATWIPRARNTRDDMARTVGLNLGSSVIWSLHPRVNLLVEGIWLRDQEVVAAGRTRTGSAAWINPGVRWSFNGRQGLQVVPGIAYTIGVGPSRGDDALFLYLSVEHPFRRAIP